MEQKIRFRIVLILMMTGILVGFFIVGRSAFIAGGRVACHNTNPDNVLNQDFECELDVEGPVLDGSIPIYDFGGGDLK